MKSRCRGSNNALAKKYYREKGIEVCQEWSESFESFRDWALENGYADDLQIDRKNGDLGYSPDNCRWATRSQQMQNTHKRTNAKTSVFKGVSWHSQSRKWRMQIICNNVNFGGGLYATEEDAAMAYDTKAIELFGEFARTNFSQTQGGVTS